MDIGCREDEGDVSGDREEGVGCWDGLDGGIHK